MNVSPTDRATVFIGMTTRQLVCCLGECLFVLAGLLVGMPAIAELVKQFHEANIEPPHIAQLGIDWYWLLLALLGMHILAWPIVPRVLGTPGVVLWYILGVLVPLLIVAVPAILVISVYLHFLQ